MMRNRNVSLSAMSLPFLLFFKNPQVHFKTVKNRRIFGHAPKREFHAIFSRTFLISPVFTSFYLKLKSTKRFFAVFGNQKMSRISTFLEFSAKLNNLKKKKGSQVRKKPQNWSVNLASLKYFQILLN
jgi:hypothetical protein